MDTTTAAAPSTAVNEDDQVVGVREAHEHHLRRQPPLEEAEFHAALAVDAHQDYRLRGELGDQLGLA